MKSPSKNISASLRGQSPAGRSPISVSVSKVQSASSISGIVPGEMDVEAPPGKQMQDRSASKYADAMGSRVR